MNLLKCLRSSRQFALSPFSTLWSLWPSPSCVTCHRLPSWYRWLLAEFQELQVCLPDPQKVSRCANSVAAHRQACSLISSTPISRRGVRSTAPDPLMRLSVLGARIKFVAKSAKVAEYHEESNIRTRRKQGCDYSKRLSNCE